MALGYKNEWRDFGWSSNFTFTYNKNKIKRLADGVTNRITGEPIEMPYVDKARLGGSTSPVVRLTEGGSMGDLYINRDLNAIIMVISIWMPRQVCQVWWKPNIRKSVHCFQRLI